MRSRLASILLVAVLASPAAAGKPGILARLFKRSAPVVKHDPELHQALELKALWHKRDRLISMGLPLSEVREKVGVVEDHLLGGRVYAVDAKKGARTLQSSSEVKVHAAFLDRELADFLPPDTHKEVKTLLDRALARVRGKQLYARAGLHGLSDLLEDELIANHIARTPAEVAKLAVALEAVRAAASAHSLHAFGGEQKAPLEVQYAMKLDPSLQSAVAEAQAAGVELWFRRAERTPKDALEAINRIAVLTQENYLHNWLPQLVRDGKKPVLRFSQNGLTRAREGGLVEEGASDAEIAAQLEHDVETIQLASRRMMGFVLSGTTQKTSGLDDKLERAIDPLRKDHAIARMLFDNADERTHDAQEIVKKMMWVGPIAHGLESLDLGTAAKLFAGSADDLLGEWAEIKALTGSGFSKKEVWKRVRVLAPVFAGATYASYEVEHLLANGNEAAAGALFGVSAVALSMTTALQSMVMYKKAYDVLLKEGKIAGKIGPLAGDARFQQTLKALDKASALLRPDGKQALLEEVKKHLDTLGESITAEDKAGILDALSKVDLAAIDAQVRSPSRLAKWKAAVKQDFSNPTRLGILIGSSLAPVVGVIAAKTGLMHNGFAMAAIGSTESLVGGLAVQAARRLDDFKQKRALEKKLAALE